MAKARKVSAAVAADAQKLLAGKEPTGSNIDYKNKKGYKLSLVRAFNWYNSTKSTDDSRKYAQAWAKANGYDKKALSAIADAPSSVMSSTMGWVARLLTNGAKLSATHITLLKDTLDTAIAMSKKKAAVVKDDAMTKPTKSVQEHVKEKTQELLGELEGAFDDWYHGSDTPPLFDIEEDGLYKLFQSRETPKIYVEPVVGWADSKLKEFGSVLLTKDKHIKEGYSNFNGRQLGNIIKFFNEVKKQATKYGDFKKVQKAPRKRKEKPASVQVAKMKYMPSHKEFGVSVNPALIIGAQQLWTFNFKSRVLAVYNASGAAGLAVKGSTMLNYDTETSIQKRLRPNKAQDGVKSVRDAGKVALRKIMDGIKAVEYKVNGRINKDTILVRVS